MHGVYLFSVPFGDRYGTLPLFPEMDFSTGASAEARCGGPNVLRVLQQLVLERDEGCERGHRWPLFQEPAGEVVRLVAQMPGASDPR